MFKDITDYTSDQRPWLVFDRQDGIVARGISKLEAAKLACVNYRRMCIADKGQTEAEIRRDYPL